jgi:hypothetical protein
VARYQGKSFWRTRPGVVTAAAGIVSLVAVCIGALSAGGVTRGASPQSTTSAAKSRPAQSSRGTPGQARGTEPRFARITQYNGTWINADPRPDAVARVVIGGYGPLVNVHVFAACKPVDCDWGIRTPNFSEPLTALFDLGDGHTEKLTMLLSQDATRLALTEQSSVSRTHSYSLHR